MALWIQNVTSPLRAAGMPDEYVVRVNQHPPLAWFRHSREDGAAACLRAAADAIEAAQPDASQVGTKPKAECAKQPSHEERERVADGARGMTWQVKDFADGWIDVADEPAARALSEIQSGAAIRPKPRTANSVGMSEANAPNPIPTGEGTP